MLDTNSTIDTLIFDAVFGENETAKNKARSEIKTRANKQGAVSSSMYPLYHAIGKGEVEKTFTVPAFNIRALTYDCACIIFRLAKKRNIGPFIFEIARSEIEYTDQRPQEYTAAIRAAAIKEEYQGPIFLQGDHYQLSNRRFKENNNEEIEKIKKLIDESLQADFLNIDIDASTLVDLSKSSLDEQQKNNYEVTAALTKHIRKHEKSGTVSIGGEIGHIGGKNSTTHDLIAFMKGYQKLIEEKIGISKISIQTGTSHGGTVLSDGSISDVTLDFGAIRDIGEIATKKYNLAGVVQHGASTLPQNLFSEFPKNKTLEIHLATGFQNIVYDNMPTDLKNNMYAWVEEHLQKEWEEGWSQEQFLYKTRKKAIGPFKKELWTLSEKEKKPILKELEKQFLFLFQKLNVLNTRDIIDSYYPTP